jgi:hypothetical protein
MILVNAGFSIEDQDASMHCDRTEELSKFEVPMRKNSYVGKPLLAHRTTSEGKPLAGPVRSEF